MPRASAIICTAGTREILIQCVDSLLHQSIDVEILIVGPSHLAERIQEVFSNEMIKFIALDSINLNEARNLGACSANTDYILYIDDDAIAEPDWAENLLAGLQKSDICGGRTLTGTSTKEEWSDASITPFGRGLQNYEYETRSSNGILNRTVAGNNFGVTRKAFNNIEGFDEIFRVFDDETDFCYRAANAGLEIAYVKSAVVHHFSVESDLRKSNMVPTAMFRPWFSRSYFAIRHGVINELNSLTQGIYAISQEIELATKSLFSIMNDGLLSRIELDKLISEIYAGAEAGLSFALQNISTTERTTPTLNRYFFSKELSEQDNSIISARKEIHVVLIVRENPVQKSAGGIARWYFDLANSLAEAGKQVTLITSGGADTKISRVVGRFWLHELGDSEKQVKSNYVQNYDFAPRNYPHPISDFVQRLQSHLLWLDELRPIDLTVTPVFEGIGASLSMRYSNIVTMHTTSEETLSKSHGWFTDKEFLTYWAEPIIKLEELSLVKSVGIIANSETSSFEAQRLLRKYTSNVSKKVKVTPHGVQESTRDYVPFEQRNDLVIVGRIEPRKGTDLAIASFIKLSKKFPSLKLHVIGNDNLGWLSKIKGADSDVIVHHAALSDQERDALVSHSLATIVSSRYESFGLIVPESLRFGTPVICNGVAGLMDFEGLPGVRIVDFESVGCLLDCSDLFEDVNTWKKISLGAISTYESTYSLSKAAINTFGILEEFAKVSESKDHKTF